MRPAARGEPHREELDLSSSEGSRLGQGSPPDALREGSRDGGADRSGDGREVLDRFPRRPVPQGGPGLPAVDAALGAGRQNMTDAFSHPSGSLEDVRLHYVTPK